MILGGNIGRSGAEGRRSRRVALAALMMASSLAAGGMAVPAYAQEATRDFDIPAQPLANALTTFGQQSGLQVSVQAPLVEGRTSSAVKGALSPMQALSHLLTGTGLSFRVVGSTVTLEPAPQSTGDAIQLGPVRVEGEGGNAGAGLAYSGEETAVSPVRGYVAKRSATGTKTDTPIIETPQSISVVTADRIEAIGATRLRDALAYTPGVDISPYGSDSRIDWINLRGFDALASIYLDGLSLRTNSNGGYGAWQTETYGTERIEILRGPTSVLYGQNAPGGVINVVSKRPTAEPLHEIQAQIGTYNRYQIAGDFSGPIGVSGNLLYRITGLVREAELPWKGLPDDRVYIAPALTWQPSNDTSLTVMGSYLRGRAGSSWQAYPAVGTLLPNPNGKILRSTYLGDPNFSYYNVDQWMIGYQFEHLLGENWRVRQNTRYGEVDTDYADLYKPAGFVIVNASDPNDPANFRTIRRFATGGTDDSKSFTIDNQIEGSIGSESFRHKILFGIDYSHSIFDQTQFYGGSAPLFDVFSPTYGGLIVAPASYRDARVKISQTGFYIQDQIRIRDRLIVTLGGRYDHASIKSSDHLALASTTQNDDKFTMRAGLVYLAPSGWAPYFSYSESYTPTTTINPETSQPFDPETGQQYEAGLRYQPPGTHTSLSVAVFDLRRQNYITYDAARVPKMTGEITVRGMEFEALVQPVPNSNLTVSYTWTPKADVTKSSDLTAIGKQLRPVSEHRLSIWGDYLFDFGLKIGAGARYVGSNQGQNEAAPAKVPAYTLLDALVSYDFGKWSMAVNARNLTKKTYIGSCISAVNCFYGDPRTVAGTLSYRW